MPEIDSRSAGASDSAYSAPGGDGSYRATSNGLGFAGGGDPYKYIRTGTYPNILQHEDEVTQGWLDRETGAPVPGSKKKDAAEGSTTKSLHMAHFQTSKTQILAFGPAQPKWDPTKGTNQYFNEHSLFQYNRFDKEPVTKDVALDDSSPTKGPADKSKEKVLVKLYTESECAECSRYTTTYVKQMLHHIGSIVDLKVVPFGKAVVSKEPSKKDLELDFKAGYKQLTSLSQVMCACV